MMALAQATPYVPANLLLLTLLKLVSFFLGLLVVYLGYKAWRASRRKPILWLTLGMLVMTLGVLSEGVAYQGFQWTIDQSHLFEAVVTLVAFGLVVYSLYVRDLPTHSARIPTVSPVGDPEEASKRGPPLP